MPIYEYRCEHCGHEMESIQKINDEPLKDCPICKQATLCKLISAVAFKLTGTGWYETDFKDNKSETRKDATKEGEQPSKDNSDKEDSSKETKRKESDYASEKSTSKAEPEKNKHLQAKTKP